MKIQDVFSIPKEYRSLADKMEVYDKLNNTVDNYLNMVALYGNKDEATLECLYRGIRNAFLLGFFFHKSLEKK